MCLGLFTTIGKIIAGNNIESKINALKQNTCDTTVKALTEQLKQKRVFNVTTGANFIDTKTPKLLSELIPYIKSSENVSENAKKELFAAMSASEYFKPSPNRNIPDRDKLVQDALLHLQLMEQNQQIENDMLEFQLQQQMNDQLFQQQQQQDLEQQFNQMHDML